MTIKIHFEAQTVQELMSHVQDFLCGQIIPSKKDPIEQLDPAGVVGTEADMPVEKTRVKAKAKGKGRPKNKEPEPMERDGVTQIEDPIHGKEKEDIPVPIPAVGGKGSEAETLLRQLAAKDLKKAYTVLEKYDATKWSDIDPSDYAAVEKECRELLA